MSSFLKVLFQFFLGWTRGLSVQIWNELNHPNGDRILSWIASNWIFGAAVLCVAGLIIDLAVYLFRWQPYRVWRRFFIALFHPSGRSNQDPDRKKSVSAGGKETSSDKEADDSNTNLLGEAIRPRRRRLRVTGLFAEEKEEAPYTAPQEMIDARKAYHKPVYPRNWKGEERNSDENG